MRFDSTRLLTLASVLALSSCLSAPRLRVDPDVLDKITIENKMRLFEAENELNIAIDARDQVVDEIAQLKDDLKRARKKRDVAERDEDVFEDKGDAERVRLATLRREAASAHMDYLDARLDWARERLGKERKSLIVARARFELAKAKLVKKNNVPGASRIDLEDFEAQVQDYSEDVDEADEDIQEAKAAMDGMEQAWVAKNDALRSASGGALGSRWLD